MERKRNSVLRHSRTADFTYLALLLIVSLLGYGRYLFHAPIYDFYNFFFPYRYSVVDAISNGAEPFWNTYQSMGLPAHADPQSGVFYLPVWLFALVFGKYTTVMCGLEFIFHAFVGGAGFYFLAKHFAKDRLPAFVAAAFYLLSGFFVGNGQHLSWIISAAWLPWVLFSFVKLMEEPSLRTMLLFPVFFSLMFSGGYPGFVFVLAYVLVAITIYYVVSGLHHRRKDILKMTGFAVASLGITLCLCAPALYSFWEARTEITRGANLDFSKTAEAFTLQGLLSLLFPYFGVGGRDLTGTDPSMGSIYLGLFALPAIVVGLRRNRNTLLWVLVGTAVLTLIAAFGTNIPANRFGFEHLPLLGHIRLPGLYRLFFITPMLIVAAVGFKYLKDNWQEHRRSMFITLYAMAGTFAISWIILIELFHNIEIFDDVLPCQKVIVGALVATTVFLLAAIVCHFGKSPRVLALLAVIMIAEPVVQANICGTETIYTADDVREQLAKATSTEGFPVPGTLSSSQELAQKHGLNALWTNVGMFVKEVEYDSYNPFRLYRHKRMLQKYDEADTTLVLPTAFFPTTVLCDTLPHFLTPDTAYTGKTEGVFSGTLHNAMLEISSFEPGKIVINAQATEPRPLVLCQNYYKGWQATIDGKPTEIATANFAMMSVPIPAGEHKVVFEYRRPEITMLFRIQYLGTILCIVLLCGMRIVRN
ncbi:MAG: YfhO family protein [Bacteroidales bacterium]|nr:YfhO family protein [Bacteroidales bacterium]